MHGSVAVPGTAVLLAVVLMAPGVGAESKSWGAEAIRAEWIHRLDEDSVPELSLRSEAGRRYVRVTWKNAERGLDARIGTAGLLGTERDGNPAVRFPGAAWLPLLGHG